jgi:hypothetical protein
MERIDPDFRSRVDRINRARQIRVRDACALRAGGVFVPRHQRLGYSLPLKGLILAFVLVVMVKACLIWVMGLDQFQIARAQLLGGSGLGQVAARILVPDQLSMAVVDQIDRLWSGVMVWWQSVSGP